MSSKIQQKQQIDIQQQQQPAPKSVKDKAGKEWKCLEKGNCLKSKQFLIAMAVLGVVGLLVAGVGITGYFAHLNMLPTSLAKLNTLGAMGNYAIAVIAVGGTMTLVGIAATIMLVKRYLDVKHKKDREAELEKQKLENQKKETHSLEEYEQRMKSIEELPQEYRTHAQKMGVGTYQEIPQKNGTVTLIGCTKNRYICIQNIPRADVQKEIDVLKEIFAKK